MGVHRRIMFSQMKNHILPQETGVARGSLFCVDLHMGNGDTKALHTAAFDAVGDRRKTVARPSPFVLPPSLFRLVIVLKLDVKSGPVAKIGSPVNIADDPNAGVSTAGGGWIFAYDIIQQRV